MAPINIQLDVPPEIEEGLYKGIYERVGGVIRRTDNKRTITWLRETNIEENGNVKDVIAKTGQVIKDNKVAFGLIATLGLALTGGAIYIRDKNKKENAEFNTKFNTFNQSFITYIEEAKEEKLSEVTVEKIKSHLTDLNQFFSKSSIKFDDEIQEHWRILIESIFKFTKTFAEKNNYPMEDSEFKDEGFKSNLIKLEDYLKVQKDIFNVADDDLEVEES